MNRLRFRVWDKAEQKFADWPVYFNLTNSEIVTELWYGYEIQVEEPLQNSDYIVQQSTGLFDKNGKEIFVGDILEYEMIMGFGWYENGRDVVIYDENELKIKMNKRDDYSLNRVVAVGCEVIGNKFEHPHLLEEE